MAPTLVTHTVKVATNSCLREEVMLAITTDR